MCMRVRAINCAACMQIGFTPLVAASSTGRLEVVQALLAVGADKEAKDKVRGGGHWAMGGCIFSPGAHDVVAGLCTEGQDGPYDGLEGGPPRGDAGAEGSRGQALVPGMLG